MKHILLLLALLPAMAAAQSFTVHQGAQATAYNAGDVDSLSFSAQATTSGVTVAPRQVNATWCSLGTSITWYNQNVSAAGGRFTMGYQDRLMKRVHFSRHLNRAVNGGVLASAVKQVVKADYYTIEHGINDWGHSTPVGTIDDYVNNTKNGTFAATYRVLIDAIFAKAPQARVVLCTPRKGYGFNGYLPSTCDAALNGIRLSEYADIVRQIAMIEGFPLADFYAECGGQHNLASLSIDVALHPNDAGHQMMANVLLRAMEKALTDD